MITILLKMMTMLTKLFCIRLAKFSFFSFLGGDDVKITMAEEDVMILFNRMIMLTK